MRAGGEGGLGAGEAAGLAAGDFALETGVLALGAGEVERRAFSSSALLILVYPLIFLILASARNSATVGPRAAFFMICWTSFRAIIESPFFMGFCLLGGVEAVLVVVVAYGSLREEDGLEAEAVGSRL